MNKELLDLNKANIFHMEEQVQICEASDDFSTNDELLLENIIDIVTFRNHAAMLVWIYDHVVNKSTTSYQAYLDKCKELSIPHYTNN